MTQVADRVALPIRVHDLLLGLAGRLDDDALSDARELLASAELDRSLELVAGCLVAGRIPLSPVERRDLDALFAEAHCDSVLIQQLKVDDGRVRPPVHRFHPGLVDSPQGTAETGVAEAVHRVLDVLPDIRAMWCVWRVTPAGAVAGSVPHRVVLVEIGPRGFAPATAYRIEHALRRAGVRASVEVLRDSSPLTEYHRQAMQQARRVAFRGTEPATPVEVDEPPPRTWASERRERPSSSWKSRKEPQQPAVSSWIPVEPEPEPQPPVPEPPLPPAKAETTTVMEPVSAPPAVEDAVPEPPARPERPDFEQPSLGRTEPVAAPAPVPEPDTAAGAALPKAAADTFEDSDLNDQERDLLRQLQEELAKREQADAAADSKKLSWQADRSGRHSDADSKWSSPATPRIINGVQPGDSPRFPPKA